MRQEQPVQARPADVELAQPTNGETAIPHKTAKFIWLPPEVAQALKKRAAQAYVTQSIYVTQLLEAHWRRPPKNRCQRKMPEAPRQEPPKSQKTPTPAERQPDAFQGTGGWLTPETNEKISQIARTLGSTPEQLAESVLSGWVKKVSATGNLKP